MLSAELQRRGGAHSTAGGVGAADVETVATFNVSKASLQLQVDASTRATRRVRDQHASFPLTIGPQTALGIQDMFSTLKPYGK